jgi:hypothetical protein
VKGSILQIGITVSFTCLGTLQMLEFERMELPFRVLEEGDSVTEEEMSKCERQPE